MAQSPEYPDLKWVQPKSWTNANRGSVQLIVIHTTEGSAHNGSAEDGAAYDARRTDGTSTHYFVDNDSVVQCVRTEDRAHTARAQGNRRGIQYELCTRAATSQGGWADPYHQAMLKRAAKQCARDAKKWGIRVRKLSHERVAAGEKGFCGHVDITYAFPADNGSHTDPGKSFPWNQFLEMVRAEMAPPPPPKEPDVATDQEDLAAKLKLKDAASGGGQLSTIGDSVLGHGYPRRPGEQRQAAWKNLQNLQLELDTLRSAGEAYGRGLAQVNEKLDRILTLLEPAPPAE